MHSSQTWTVPSSGRVGASSPQASKGASRYAEFLKIDFPRLPLTGDLDLFRALVLLGGELVALHLLESPKLAQPITEFIGGSNPVVEKISWSRDTVWLDKAQTTGFQGVREDVGNFHIGGYKVCEKWLKDRKGRTLSEDDIAHYQKIVVALSETIRLMADRPRDRRAWGLARSLPGHRHGMNPPDPPSTLYFFVDEAGDPTLFDAKGRILVGHMTLVRQGTQYVVNIVDGPYVARHRPSVDVLFRSAAQAAGRNAVGVLLTGMGDDGRGYCTAFNCNGNGCPDEAACVVFGASVPGCGFVDRGVSRSARSFCMKTCATDQDCRSDEGYLCRGIVRPGVATSSSTIEGVILDDDQTKRVCVYVGLVRNDAGALEPVALPHLPFAI